MNASVHRQLNRRKRRILRRIELLGSADLAGYAERLRLDPEELSSLYRDLLIGVTDGKTAKAYPAAILAQHGVVQERMADGPIAVTW